MQAQSRPAPARPLPLPPAHIWQRTPALVEALDKKRQPPPRGKASDALGKRVLELLWRPLDPYPFIFLNLILSCLTAIQAPIIMMSQNRQEAKDRVRSQHDYQINLKA